MIAFFHEPLIQRKGLYRPEGAVFHADFAEPEALPNEYVKRKIYAFNVSHATVAKYNNLIRLGTWKSA